MNNLSKIFSVAALVMLLPSCGTSPKTNFYLLSSDNDIYSEQVNELNNKSKNVSDDKSDVSDKVSIGLWRIDLPELIDRSEIVTVTGPYTIELADFHHWADDLEYNISTLVTSELSHDLNSGYVYISPWPSSKKLDYQVKVYIRKFIGKLGGDIKLEGVFIVLSSKSKIKRIEVPFALSEKTRGGSYSDVVQAMSQLVVRLSAQISSTISGQIKRQR